MRKLTRKERNKTVSSKHRVIYLISKANQWSLPGKRHIEKYGIVSGQTCVLRESSGPPVVPSVVVTPTPSVVPVRLSGLVRAGFGFGLANVT